MRLPSSKSVAARWLILAAQADGASRFTKLPRADDTRDLLGILAAAGVPIREEGRALAITGLGGPPRGFTGTVALGDGAATARFALAWLASGHGEMQLELGPSLATRPIDGLMKCLDAMGAHIQRRGRWLDLQADGLSGGTCDLGDPPTSQFASALLLAGPSMAEPPVLSQRDPALSAPYLHLTRLALERFGAPGVPLRARDGMVPPDATAGALALAAAIITGRSMRIDAPDDDQPDRVFPGLLERAGLDVAVRSSCVTVSSGMRWPQQRLCVDLAGNPDLAPAVAVLAAVAPCGVQVTGAPHLAAKESHRIEGLVRGLNKAGIPARALEDGFRTRPAGHLIPTRIEDRGDHRLAMTWGVLALLEPGIRTNHPSCVTKSWPTFWEDLSAWDRELTGTVGGAQDLRL